MAYFTTEHVLQTGLKTDMKSCQVGDDIWIVQRSSEGQIEVWRLCTETKNFKKIETICPDITRSFILTTSNGKLYILEQIMFNTRLYALNLSTLEWEFVRVVQVFCDTKEIVIMDRKMYILMGSEMQIVDLDTGMKSDIYLPNIGRRYSNICELNGSIYLACVDWEGMRSIYQYDKNRDMFVGIPSTDYIDQTPQTPTFVWSSDNKIYQAFKVKDDLIIGYFDVKTNRWYSVIEANFEGRAEKNVFGDDQKIYVVADNMIDIRIREVDLLPKTLEKISMIGLTDITAAKYCEDGFKLLTNVLPFQMRYQYFHTVLWKVQETKLGRMEHLIEMIEKLEIAKNEQMAKLDELMKEEYVELIDTKKDMHWQLKECQKKQDRFFLKLQKEYGKILQRERSVCDVMMMKRKKAADGQEKWQIEYRAGRFKELQGRYQHWVQGRVDN